MKKIRISELPLSESTNGLYLLATDSENKSVKVSMDSMSEERADGRKKARRGKSRRKDTLRQTAEAPAS